MPLALRLRTAARVSLVCGLGLNSPSFVFRKKDSKLPTATRFREASILHFEDGRRMSIQEWIVKSGLSQLRGVDDSEAGKAAKQARADKTAEMKCFELPPYEAWVEAFSSFGSM